MKKAILLTSICAFSPALTTTSITFAARPARAFTSVGPLNPVEPPVAYLALREMLDWLDAALVFLGQGQNAQVSADTGDTPVGWCDQAGAHLDEGTNLYESALECADTHAICAEMVAGFETLFELWWDNC